MCRGVCTATVAVTPSDRSSLVVPGFNTGGCQTGDADCDGNAYSEGVQLLNLGGRDPSNIGNGEYAYVVLNFAPLFASSFNASTRAVVGIPVSGDVSTARVALYNTSANATTPPMYVFGRALPLVPVNVYNTPVGPTRTQLHLEMSVANFSGIPKELRLPWNYGATGCVSFDAFAGSIVDDGSSPIGEDFIGEKNNCPSLQPSPLPDATPLPAYLNRYPGRAPLYQEPVYFNPLACEWQFQQKLVVSSAWRERACRACLCVRALIAYVSVFAPAVWTTM